jgi:hypothetical protein
MEVLVREKFEVGRRMIVVESNYSIRYVVDSC